VLLSKLSKVLPLPGANYISRQAIAVTVTTLALL
jgi:hypothetical protein